MLVEFWRPWGCKERPHRKKILNASYIYNLHILNRQFFVFFVNFGNYSKSIFGNHLTGNCCQIVKSCVMKEVKKW